MHNFNMEASASLQCALIQPGFLETHRNYSVLRSGVLNPNRMGGPNRNVRDPLQTKFVTTSSRATCAGNVDANPNFNRPTSDWLRPQPFLRLPAQDTLSHPCCHPRSQVGDPQHCLPWQCQATTGVTTMPKHKGAGWSPQEAVLASKCYFLCRRSPTKRKAMLMHFDLLPSLCS